ncbi:hypothetical protein BJF90_24080 [Pseudonocardia sp. CNS-004]|nr:hypothetical protein BJF90_24080 [Pseudonocardia sp. CNS-004]
MGRSQAVLHGTGRIFNIDHSYITLEGFTIDGQEDLTAAELPADLGAIDAFKAAAQPRVKDSKLVYIGSADTARDITGVTIRNMFLTEAGTECVRLRNNATGNTIADSVIQYCGLFGKPSEGDEGDDEDSGDDESGDDGDEGDDEDSGDEGGDEGGGRFEFHNGEAVYIGTSPKSDNQPMHENDESSGNQIIGNTIRPFGSECFNVKENAHGNVFENNECSGNTEPREFNGSNIELRGHGNIVRGNVIADSAGWNVKIQSDDEDDYDNGGNILADNTLSGAVAEPVRIGSDARRARSAATASRRSRRWTARRPVTSRPRAREAVRGLIGGCRGGAGGCDHRAELGVQAFQVGEGEAEPLDHGRRDPLRIRAQGPALPGEGHGQRALVARHPLPGHQPCRFQPLEQRGQRGGVEGQRGGQVGERARRALPQSEHHQVLRVGEPHRLEQRPVERDDVACCHRECEADLTVQA